MGGVAAVAWAPPLKGMKEKKDRVEDALNATRRRRGRRYRLAAAPR